MSSPVYGCIAGTSGHLLLSLGYTRRRSGPVPCIYLQSEDKAALETALLAIRAQSQNDLWVTESSLKGENKPVIHRLIATTSYFPASGYALPQLYSYVVTQAGIDREVLKTVYRECLALEKFSAPPCYACPSKTMGCLERAGMGQVLANSRELPGLTEDLVGSYYNHRRYSDHFSYRDFMADPSRISAGVSGTQGNIGYGYVPESGELLEELLKACALVTYVTAKHGLSPDNSMFSPQYPPAEDLNLEPSQVAATKKRLSERSTAAAASRRTVRTECSKCLIATQCDQRIARYCVGAITSLDQIRKFMVDKVTALFGYVPDITEPWVQAALKLGGEDLFIRPLDRKNGRPFRCTVLSVIPPGVTLTRRGWRPDPLPAITRLVINRRGILDEMAFYNGVFTNYQADVVKNLLARPDVALDHDWLLAFLYLQTRVYFQTGWGGHRTLQAITKTPGSVGLTVHLASGRWSRSYAWRIGSLAELHNYMWGHNLRGGVTR